MVRLMPTKRSWVDVGHGNPDFVGQESQHRHAGDGETLRPRASFEKRHARTPSKSSERESIRIPTPPPSENKNHAAIPSRTSKAFYSQYDYRLKVKDSEGRTMSRCVYRWYNVESQGRNSRDQFRAGLYKKEGCTIPPPCSDDELRSAFLNHLTPVKKLSPFISTFENFLPALNRALKSDKDAFIAIIDLQKHKKSARKRFPKSADVIWPVKQIINQYEFKLENGYKGYEWLIYGTVEKSAIIQTIKVSELREFALARHIPKMGGVLRYIGEQPHAYALLKKLHITLPKTNHTTGQLVGSVLDHLHIPKESRVLVARKINNMMRFKGWNNRSREHAFLKGVCNFNTPDSDSDSDGMDVFVVSTDEEDEYDSDATYHDSEDPSNARGRRAPNITDNDSDSDATSFPADEEEDEQALVDAQIHATEKEWIQETPAAAHKMLRMSHVEVRKLTAAQRKGYRRVKTTPVPVMIDLTNDADDERDADVDDERDADEETIEVQPWTTEEDATNVERAARANKTMTLPLRSTSMRSTFGSGGRLARLEADARMEVMEIIQFD